jgi:hypothetical protein
MTYNKKIIELFNNLKVNKSWSFEEYKPSETSKWTHKYHKYPAKFIPQLVEKLFDKYINSDEAYINDPFIGSGTTIVSAVSRGFKASGTDINKIACLITKVKANPIEPSYLEHNIKTFLGQIKYIGSPQQTLLDEKIEPLIPEKHEERIDYWFSAENKLILGKILRIIQEIEDVHIRDFLKVAFSHILKNCSIWLQKSTKPTRDLTKKPSKPFKMLKYHLRRMIRGNNEFYNIVPQKIRDNIQSYLNIKIGDAKKQPVEDDSIDLIVSSSPYVTSYEYADLHQLSTIWFDYADDLKKYREDFIGTAYKEYKNKIPKSQIALEIIDDMSKKNEKVANEINSFFVDMDEVFDESYRILKMGARCCYVIGNTALKGIKILNAEVFAESLQYAGYTLDKVIKREIPSKILPQKRDKKTGQFAPADEADTEAYPVEYIIIGLKE